MKINPRLLLSLLVFACIAFTGCNNPVLHNRPSDRACIQWLDGKSLVVEKGILVDDKWTISANTFTTFEIQSITGNSDGTATAAVQFEVTDGPKSLRVNGNLLFRYHKQDDACELISFTVTRLVKLGKW